MDWIAPVVAAILLAVSTVTGIILNNRSTRSGQAAAHAPDVTDAWAEANRARDRMHVLEDLYYAVRGAFKSVLRRITDMHPDFELTKSERAALESELPAEETPQNNIK